MIISKILVKTAEHFGMKTLKEQGFYSDDNVDLICDDHLVIRLYSSDTDTTDYLGMFGVKPDGYGFVFIVNDLRALKYLRYMAKAFEEQTVSELTQREAKE